MYLNKALIIGNLTRDPELKALPSGGHVATFSLATNRVWKDQDGNRKENTDYHNIVVFGRQAENTSQYLSKGDTALVEGRMQTRSWEDQDGNKRYRTEVVADRVQFGPKKQGGGNNTGNDTQSDQESGQGSKQSGNDVDTIEYPDENINPDDIPF